VLAPVGTIFDDLGALSTQAGDLIQTFGVDTVPAFNQLLFDIPVQFINLGSNLFDLLTGTTPAADAVTGLETDLTTMLGDLSGLFGVLDPSMAADLGTAPGARAALPMDLLTLF
jgi:hypothetical protein